MAEKCDRKLFNHFFPIPVSFSKIFSKKILFLFPLPSPCKVHQRVKEDDWFWGVVYPYWYAPYALTRLVSPTAWVSAFDFTEFQLKHAVLMYHVEFGEGGVPVNALHPTNAKPQWKALLIHWNSRLFHKTASCFSSTASAGHTGNFSQPSLLWQ